MVLLGLILLAAAVVAAVELILANRGDVSVSMWNQTWHVNLFWVAVAGAAILVVGLIGLGLMRAGTARSMRRRRERRELAAENRRLNEHVAARDEVVEPGPAREPLGERVSDRLHHDRNHDGIDDRTQGGAAAATPGAAAPVGTDVPPDSPYRGPADRPGYVPPAGAAPAYPVTDPAVDAGRHADGEQTVRTSRRV